MVTEPRRILLGIHLLFRINFHPMEPWLLRASAALGIVTFLGAEQEELNKNRTRIAGCWAAGLRDTQLPNHL